MNNMSPETSSGYFSTKVVTLLKSHQTDIGLFFFCSPKNSSNQDTSASQFIHIS